MYILIIFLCFTFLEATPCRIEYAIDVLNIKCIDRNTALDVTYEKRINSGIYSQESSRNLTLPAHSFFREQFGAQLDLESFIEYDGIKHYTEKRTVFDKFFNVPSSYRSISIYVNLPIVHYLNTCNISEQANHVTYFVEMLTICNIYVRCFIIYNERNCVCRDYTDISFGNGITLTSAKIEEGNKFIVMSSLYGDGHGYMEKNETHTLIIYNFDGIRHKISP